MTRHPTRARLKLGRLLWLSILTMTAWSLVVPAASAYIDGASGSMLFQFLIAGIAAAAMTIRLFWRRIVGLFRRADTAEQAAQPVASDDR